MANYRLKIICAAAAFALAGCGETASEPAASEPAAAAGGVTIELPEAKAPPVQPPPIGDEAEADTQAKDEAPVARPAPEASKGEAAEPGASKSEAPKPEAPKTEAPAPEAAPKAEEPRAPAEQAPLPLPNAVVARTIERIGYPCGAVASSVRIEAPSGERAYRITCTSGDSYRASDSSGRFRFRKSSGSR